MKNELAKDMYELYLKGHSLAQVGKAFNGRTRQTVYKMFNRRGFKLRERPARLPFVLWRGEKYTLRNHGYYGKTRGKRTLIHRDVWQYHNGEIPPGYDVHPLDRDRTNNKISNLELIDHAEHSKIYGAGKNQWTV